jgi:hypothetical protein
VLCGSEGHKTAILHLRHLGELAQIPGIHSPKEIPQAIAMPGVKALKINTIVELRNSLTGSELDDMAQKQSRDYAGEYALRFRAHRGIPV